MSVAPATETEPGIARPDSPYVGLVPYGEDDAAFFFGRSIESGLVAANLRAARLTILYGPSGVGKTSLLMAGAVHDLREEARAEVVDCPYAVCVFRSWREDPLPGLTEAARTALQELCGPEPLAEPAASLADTLREWTTRTGTLFIVLDQFEEYFQYHPDESAEKGEVLTGFAAELARIVNDPTLAVNVLLSVREDAWAKLDHFEGHIPSLFSNYVRVDHLDLDSAREAIEGPIGAWNKSLSEGEQRYSIEPALVDTVLHATAGGRLALTAGAETSVAQAPDDRIEAPFLQLVLDKLWFDAVEDGAHTLTRSRLEALGGAKRIVENHLLNALGQLSPSEKDAASDCFRFLVSTGRTKIAHTATDLAEWTQRPEPEVAAVLDKLCAAESGRILRAVAPTQEGGSTSYELFHDILAEPVLAWRKEHEERRQLQAASRRRRRIVLFAIAFGLLPILAGLTILAYVQRAHAKTAERRATTIALGSAANSLLGSRPDVSLLLSLAAFRAGHNPSATARSSVIAALEAARRSGASAILHDPMYGIRTVGFSPDGNTLVTATDTTVRFWDVRRRVEIGKPIEGRPGAINGATLSPAGLVLATAGADGAVRLWDVRTHTLLGKPLLGPTGAVLSVAFSPNGGTLATSSNDGTVRLWDVRSRKPIGAPYTSSTKVSSLAFSPNGRTLAIAGDDATVGLFDGRTLKQLGLGLPGTTPVTAVAFSPDGGLVATAGVDGTVRLYRPRSDQPPVGKLRGHRGKVLTVAFSPDGRMLATAGEDLTVRLWNVRTGNPIGKPLVGHTAPVTTLAFSPDGRTLATGSNDKTVRLWDAGTITTFGQPFRGHTGPVFGAAFSPDGKTLATASADKDVRLWDVRTHAPIGRPLTGHTGPVWAVAFSPDGKTLASASDDQTVRLWDTRTHAPVGEPLRGHTSAVWSVAFSPDGQTLATASADGTVRLWDVQTHKERGEPARGRSGQIWSVAFSPDGTKIATAGTDGSVELLDGRTLEQLGDPLPGKSVVWGVAFSPDGKTLATAVADRTVRIWNLGNHRQIGQPFRGHTGQVFSVAFSRDGSMLATAGDDETVRLWDVRTHTQLGQPLIGHTGPVLIVVFSPDGRSLVTTSDDRTARLWNGFLWRDRADLEAQVCSLVSNLSEAEWQEFVPGLGYKKSCPG